MKIEFKCGNCKSVLRLDSVHVGRPARCPVCGTVSQVPEQEDDGPRETDDWRSLGGSGIADNPLAEEPAVRYESFTTQPRPPTTPENRWNTPPVESPVRQSVRIQHTQSGDKDGMWICALVFGIISLVIHFVLCGCGSFIAPVFSIMGFSATLFSRSSPKLPLLILNGLGLLFSMIALGLVILGMAFG